VDKQGDEEMNIMICINRAYIEYACVMLMSLKEHHKGKLLSVYIFHSELSDDDFQRMDAVIGSEGIELIPVYIPKGTAGDFEINGWVEESSFRLMAADALDDSVDRILHLDVDILINGDITDFYETDFEDNYLVVCKDFLTDEMSRQKNRENGREENLPWFNAGVCLFNLQKLRQTGIGFAFYREVLLTYRNLKIKYPDQDVLNLVFTGKVKYRDGLKYNYSPVFYKVYDQAHFYNTKEELDEHCSIIHMAAGSTPWNTTHKLAVCDMWWEYAKRTPFYSDIKMRHIRQMAHTYGIMCEKIQERLEQIISKTDSEQAAVRLENILYRMMEDGLSTADMLYKPMAEKNREPVSVIIPTYNRADMITESVKSVLNQTYADFELLVVDDGSTDDTKQVVESIRDERIRYIAMPENGGAGAARNEGIRQAKYDYIAFQDSDDYWLPEKLEKQMKLLAQHPEAGLVYCAYECRLSNGAVQIVPSREILMNEKSGHIYEYMLERNTIGAPTVLMRRECLEKTGIFNEKLSALEDWELFLRISKEYEIAYLDEALVKVHPQNDGVSLNVAGYFEARCYMVALHKEDLLQLGIFNDVVENILNMAKDCNVLAQVMELFQCYLS
jgi:lipopolysaccharide biosynthesis glycosyltransferase